MNNVTSLSTDGMVLLLIVMGLALAGFYLFLMLREGSEAQPLTMRQVAVLWGVRIGVAAMVLLALGRPAYEHIQTETRLPVVPLLVDESLSENFPAARGNQMPQLGSYPIAQRTRYTVTKEAVGVLQQKLTRSHRVRVYTFSDALTLLRELPHREQESDALLGVGDIFAGHPQPTGSYSNIGDAIREAISELSTERVSGLVVLSDGRQTGGIELEAIIKEAQQARLPIHTVTVGSEFPLRDLRIDDVIVPAEASLGDVLTFHVKVTNQISSPLKVTMELEEADAEADEPKFKRVATRTVTLPRGQHMVTISTIPEVEGSRRFRLSLPVQPDEETEENNVREIAVKVVKRTLKVLLVAGEPSREYLYMVPALLRDPIIDLSTFLQSADVDYIHQGNTNIKRLPKDVEDWSKFDVAVLFDIDPKGISAQQINGLEAMVANGGGLLVVAGRTYGMATLIQVHTARVRGLLPVEIDKNLHLNHDKIYDKPFHLERTLAARGHPVLRASSDGAVNERVWKTFTDLDYYWYHPVASVKPRAITLMQVQETEGGENAPIMAVHRYSEGVVCYSGINSLWRWRFPYESFDYDRLWTRIIRYLGEARLMGTQQQVSLATDRRTYAPGEGVQIQLRVLDPALFSQLEGQPVYVAVTDENKAKYNVPMRRDARGEPLYIGEYRARRTGTMVLHARQVAADSDSEAKPLFDVKHSFVVQMQSLEDVDTSADQAAMRRLATETGGMYFDYNTINDLNKLAEAIPTDPQLLNEIITEEVWDGWIFIILFLVLVGTELSLRKWWGLL